MADIKTLPLATPYDDLYEEVCTPMARCEARPLTAGLAPAFSAHLAQIDATQAQERQLTLAVIRAEALVIALDQAMDATVDAVVGAILVITGNDRSHWLYTDFMGSQEPADLKAPIMEEELEALEDVWLPLLQKTQFPTLAAFAPILQKQIADAHPAVDALKAANQALDHFRSEQGERGALVSSINATRKGAHGQLGVIAHSNPTALLPPSFGDSFFPNGKSGRKLSAKKLEERLATARKGVESLEERLVEARADEQRRADKKAKREGARRQKEIEKAEKRAAKANAKVAALKGETTAPADPTTPADPTKP